MPGTPAVRTVGKGVAGLMRHTVKLAVAAAVIIAAVVVITRDDLRPAWMPGGDGISKRALEAINEKFDLTPRLFCWGFDNPQGTFPLRVSDKEHAPILEGLLRGQYIVATRSIGPQGWFKTIDLTPKGRQAGM